MNFFRMKKLLKITEIASLPKKHIVSKLTKILIPNLIAQIEDLNEDYVKILGPGPIPRKDM